jgi:nucleoside 2-deoxyribosyltransferase
MMPFAERFQGYYEHIFAPLIQRLGLHPVKVDEIYTPTQISVDIFKQIQNSSIILADVTGKNPNVNYELGIAHALGKKTVIITQSGDDVPFDYRHLRYIVYDTSFAQWERKLSENIYKSIKTSLNMNSPTTSITGDDLDNLLRFLEHTALESSYEIEKTSKFVSDADGNCRVFQSWNIRAISNVTHILHGIVGDEPGTIELIRAYDKTNGQPLQTLKSIGKENHVRFVILFNKLLKPGERLQFDFDYKADGYLNHLFNKKRETIFQRRNPSGGVLYRSRTDIYELPKSDFTQSLKVEFDGSAPTEKMTMKSDGDVVLITIQLGWPDSYTGVFSYEISGE